MGQNARFRYWPNTVEENGGSKTLKPSSTHMHSLTRYIETSVATGVGVENTLALYEPQEQHYRTAADRLHESFQSKHDFGHSYNNFAL